mgnify:FL=1|tara:strand:+ start:181 stop:891 length:711 start_codon:yes stop_codon:yes gene_type:complete
MSYLDTSKYEVCKILEDNYLTILDEFNKFNFVDEVNNDYDENAVFWTKGHEASLKMLRSKDTPVSKYVENLDRMNEWLENDDFGIYKKSHSWYGMYMNKKSIWESVLLATKIFYPKYASFHKRNKEEIKNNLKLTPICTKFFNKTIKFFEDRSEVISIQIAKLPAGRSLPLHRGDRKIRRIHLGLDVPKGDIKFCVKGEEREWENGKCLGFNDFFEHRAWNNTDKDRINLILDIKR